MKNEYRDMSNLDLMLEKKRLEERYEATKTKITSLFRDLEGMDKEYQKINTVLTERKTNNGNAG